MAGKKGMKWGMKLSTPCGIEALRAQIEANTLVDVLKKHALGKVEMAPTQVTAAVALLRKVLPDVSQTSSSTTIEGTFTHVIDDSAIRSRLLPELAARGEDGEAERAPIH